MAIYSPVPLDFDSLGFFCQGYLPFTIDWFGFNVARHSQMSYGDMKESNLKRAWTSSDHMGKW